MSEAASPALSVAITCSRKQYLTADESKRILAAIQKQIISNASSPHQRPADRPTFNAQPRFEDGVIKLWCDNDHTLTWLKQIVSKLSLPSSTLVVKSQSEIQKRSVGTFVIQDNERVFEGPTDIMSTLSYQNPCINFDRLEILSATQDTQNGAFQQYREWHVRMMFPEDQKRILEKRLNSFSIGLTAVKVMFHR